MEIAILENTLMENLMEKEGTYGKTVALMMEIFQKE